MRNSEDFIHTLNTLQVQLNDIIVAFDVISLFTKVPVRDSLNLLSWQFDDGNVTLFHHILSSLFCPFNGVPYEQNEVVAMGLLLSPVIVNFFM
jgi:hypothetical protein